MTPNVLISQSEAEVERLFANDFIAHIGGEKALTLRQFYEEISDQLDSPDVGFTLDALNELLNDLQWIESERVVVYFTSTNSLISRERDPAKIGSVLNVLDATAEDWKWVDDEEDTDRKELIIVFEDSPRIRKALDMESINYALISEIA